MITLFLKSLSICVILVSVSCRELCYDDYGCFIDTYPWGGSYERPQFLLPSTPEEIGATFTLFNKDLADHGKVISAEKLGVGYNNSLKTKFIVHGYRDSKLTWVLDMKDELLKSENMNVIAVDWSPISSSTYTQAVKLN